MKKRVPLTQIMTKELVTISPNQSLYEAEELFEKHGIRHIPVTEGNQLVGVISRSDMLRISYSELSDDEERVDSLLFDTYSVPQVMTKNPVSLKSEDTVREAAELFSKMSFHSIPVVDDGKLVGIITTTDLIKYLLNQY